MKKQLQLQAVLLPMEIKNYSDKILWKGELTNRLHYSVGGYAEREVEGMIAQQLIIVDDSEMPNSIGAWCVSKNGKHLHYLATKEEVNAANNISSNKVIAAYPLIEGIPQISATFIKTFADANGKGEVWGEYDKRLICDFYLSYTENIVRCTPDGCAVLELREEKKEVNLHEIGEKLKDRVLLPESHVRAKDTLSQIIAKSSSQEYDKLNAVDTHSNDLRWHYWEMAFNIGYIKGYEKGTNDQSETLAGKVAIVKKWMQEKGKRLNGIGELNTLLNNLVDGELPNV